MGYWPLIATFVLGYFLGRASKSDSSSNFKFNASVSRDRDMRADMFQPTMGGSAGETQISSGEINLKVGGREIKIGASDTQHILSLLQNNQKIEAIKVLRELSGTGLKEAKEIVEALNP